MDQQEAGLWFILLLIHLLRWHCKVSWG